MGTPLKVTREEHTTQELLRLASDMKDAGQARRVQAISFVMDGWSRARAAAFACVDRQTLRDWVERYNKCGVDGLATLTSPSRPRLLTPSQAEELRDVVKSGPDLNKDGSGGGAAWTLSNSPPFASVCAKCTPAPSRNGFVVCA
jgi:transposase